MLLRLVPIDSKAAASFAGGRGTAEAPYLIETQEQLDNVRSYLCSHFRLMADLPAPSTPVGTSSRYL